MSLPVVIRLVLQADSLGRVVDVVAENGEEEYRQAIKRAVLRSRTSFPQKSTAASAWPRPERDVLFLSAPRTGVVDTDSLIVVTALYECDRTMRLPRGAADSIAARKVPIDEFIPVSREPEFPYEEVMRNVRYPELARRIGLEGNVIANIFVAADGSVTPCIDMTDDEIFNAAVLDALQTATFKPALDMDGKPVGTWLTVPIRFHLD